MPEIPLCIFCLNSIDTESEEYVRVPIPYATALRPQDTNENPIACVKCWNDRDDTK